MDCSSDKQFSHSDVTGMMTEIMGAIQEMKDSLKNVNADLKKEIQELRTEISDIKLFVTAELEKVKVELRAEIDLKIKSGVPSKSERKLKWMAIEAEARSRRNNLLFFGIPEAADEDCTVKILDFVKQKLDIKEPVVIQRAHRLGAPKQRTNIGNKSERPRPIIVNFLDFRQRELVRSQRVKLDSSFGVGEDQLKSIRLAKATLVPEMMEMKKSKKRAAIIWPAKLLVDGQIVKVVDPTDFFDE